jgi:putative glutamine amidotransferase
VTRLHSVSGTTNDSTTLAPVIGVTGGRILGARVSGMDPVLLDATIESYFIDYGAGVVGAGGIPVYLSSIGSPEVVSRLDGLILAGGEDIDPRRYGAKPTRLTGPHDPYRDAFEFAAAEVALAAGVPILGVCRGHQLLNVVCGGTLFEDIHGMEELDTHFPRFPAPTRTQTVHLEPGSLAHAVLGDQVDVNSFHHQAVEKLGEGVAVTGRTSDGVVEALEIPGRDVLGVQWHPELYRAPDPVFGWIVDAATRRMAVTGRVGAVGLPG